MKLSDIKDDSIREQAENILAMFKDFKIEMKLAEVIDGYQTTRIHLQMVSRRRMNSFLPYINDISYALGVSEKRITIQAPVPDKPYIGIIIAKEGARKIYEWKDAMKSEELCDTNKALMVPIGLTDYEKELYADIAELPHMLVAGSTGSGKSIFLHNIVSALISNYSPEQLRLILIDPKHVELSLYAKTPHLLTSIISDPKKTIDALGWLSEEMERRYDILEDAGTRDIKQYIKEVYTPAKKKNKEVEAMPYIVVAIDEMADIATGYPRELEAGIVRLAQMSRAVGIHLIIATQRPTVNIITGLVKANIPTRVALKVSSQIDSRTILDTSGAEKLIGAGDMLYLTGDMSYPIRIQTPYISEKEIHKIVAEQIKSYPKQKDSDLFLKKLGTEYEDDELYQSVKDLVIETGKVSTSYLQRKLKLGYSRAARLIDLLEDRGVIGPQKGSKPREVLHKDD